MHSIRGIIFDFDGTILDTETPEYDAWQLLCREYGVELPLELWATGVGVGAAVNPFDPHRFLMERAAVPLDKEALRARRRALFTELLERQEIRAGVVAYLDAAEAGGMQIGLASSSAHEWVDTHLARLGLLHRFPIRFCADDVTHTKPHPELYLRCTEAMGLTPAEVIAIEDSPNGVRAAKAAGIYCVAFPNPLTGLLPGLDLADVRVDSLLDLPLTTLCARLAAGS